MSAYSAKGFIRSIPGSSGRFFASFSIDNILYNAHGSLTRAVPEFASNSVTLTYDKLGELTSTRSFEGYIGVNISLTFTNGPSIYGKLNAPINPPLILSGNATWT